MCSEKSRPGDGKARHRAAITHSQGIGQDGRSSDTALAARCCTVFIFIERLVPTRQDDLY